MRDPERLIHGVTSAYVDVEFGGKGRIRATTPSGIFGTFASGTVQDGIVNDLGGSSFLEGLGADGRWARVATLEVEAVESGVAQYQPFESAMGFAAYGQGFVPWSRIERAGVSVRHVEPMTFGPADRP